MYSILNGVAIAALCLYGLVDAIHSFVPIEVTLGILLWIGLVITAQAFVEVPRLHAIAVAAGLVPTLAFFALYVLENSLRAAGTNIEAVLPEFGDKLYVEGLIPLAQGFIFTSILYGAAVAFAASRRFAATGAVLLVATALSYFGVIHGYQFDDHGFPQAALGIGLGWKPAAGYLAVALCMLLAHFTAQPIEDDGEPIELEPLNPEDTEEMIRLESAVTPVGYGAIPRKKPGGKDGRHPSANRKTGIQSRTRTRIQTIPGPALGRFPGFSRPLGIGIRTHGRYRG